MVKSYKGGYSILDTTPITFELEDSDSISDSYILEQLLEILAPHYNNYLRELKPIYLRYITDDFGSVVTLCSLTRQSNDFYIKGELGTNTLEIYVELGLDDDGNVIIESCSYEYYPLSLNVQNLIDGGNIQVGTKLYKHILTYIYEANNIEGNINTVVISPISSIPTTNDELKNLLASSLNNPVIVDSNDTSQMKALYLAPERVLESEFNGWWDDCSFTLGTGFNDTVTPL